MKTFIFSILFYLSSMGLSAQLTLQSQVFSSTGNQVESGGVQLFQTFGEPIIGLQSGSMDLTSIPGFQQPIPTSSTSIVWPGDANSDLVADNVDLLPIGLYYGSTGPARANASSNWLGQTADFWSASQPNGANINHADCNGDGIINTDDTLAIQLHYGLVHNRPSQSNVNGPPLVVEMLNDSISGGDTLTFAVNIGVDTQAVVDGYGFAFGLNIDTTLFDNNSLTVLFDSSWLGVVGQDLLTLTRRFTGYATLDVAITRFDQVPRSGFGRIMTCSIIVIDDLAGNKDLPQVLKIVPVPQRANNPQGALIPLSVVPAEVSFYQLNTSIRLSSQPTIVLSPQPADDWIWIRNIPQTAGKISIWSLKGKCIEVFSHWNFREPLDIASLPSGLYFIQVQVAGYVWREKFLKG
ncbi:MAG: T9SS type A sorting domain-containing protein [Bacteroidota bacterium]